MHILGIETSCDETAAAVITSKGENIKVLSSVVSSQVKLHARWGGVVPNLAAREHIRNILPVIKAALSKAKLSANQIDLLAVTRGPGLMPALLIGTTTAKTLAYLWQKPLVGIHHIEGHIYANFVDAKPKFPLLCLVVSGGHTQLILMQNHFLYKIIGQTLDDAAGEAFDKVARILKLGYPGGPAIAEAALQYQEAPVGIKKYTLPRPMIDAQNFNFSFSGLKTAVLYAVKKQPAVLKSRRLKAALAAEFQQAVIDVLLSKTLKATKIYRPKSILLAGGVSANLELRRQLGEAIKHKFADIAYHIPPLNYSLDNAAMIAVAAVFRQYLIKKRKKAAVWKGLNPDANLKIT